MFSQLSTLNHGLTLNHSCPLGKFRLCLLFHAGKIAGKMLNAKLWP
jgi:hypothetical protein